MEGKVLARIAAIVFVAVAITAAIIETNREGAAPPAPPIPSHVRQADPLREGQRRCQEMGEAAANDAECLGVWAESRDRFLGRSPAQTAPGPVNGAR